MGTSYFSVSQIGPPLSFISLRLCVSGGLPVAAGVLKGALPLPRCFYLIPETRGRTVEGGRIVHSR